MSTKICWNRPGELRKPFVAKSQTPWTETYSVVQFSTESCLSKLSVANNTMYQNSFDFYF